MEGPFVILIADANPRNRNLLHNYLVTELHYGVIDAASGPEVLKLAEEQKPDLILMDTRLPVSNGYETAKALKSNPATRMIRILLLAPVDEKEKRLYAIESGADEMLLKPLDKSELLVRVESFLRIKFFYDQLLVEREKVERMKEDFLAMVTHDLKTPLTSIIGNTQLLMLQKKLADDKTDSLRAIDIASRNLLFLVNNLLNVMRMDSGMMTYAPEDFPLERLAEEVVAMVSPLAQRKNVKLTFHPSKGWVHADMEKIRQVLSNLLSNAIKFTPQTGAVSLTHRQDGGKIVVEVSDTGPGITKEDQSRLFQKFSQKKGERGGTGLGLYIVKKMLDLHGSEIEVKSEPGKGTTFFFCLDMAPSPVPQGTDPI